MNKEEVRDLMNKKTNEWIEELNAHNGKWTKKAFQLAAESNKLCSQLGQCKE